MTLAATLPQTAAAEQADQLEQSEAIAAVAQDGAPIALEDVLSSLIQASEETGVAHREDWLERFSAGRAAVGVDGLTAIREFGVAIKALRAAGRVVTEGEFAWIA
jgi:hypothetical protein